MMPAPITVEIDSRSVMDALQQLLRQGQDMRPVMDAIGQRMEERVSARFETKTDPNGHAWLPWKPSTAKSYPKSGNGTLLDRHGDMLGSLSHQADRDSVSIGFGAVGKDGYAYPAVHEFGAPKANIPRRGMLMADPEAGTLGAEDERTIMDLLNGYFAKSL